MNSRIFIIGGGYSLKGFNFKCLNDKGIIIGIKDATLYTKCHIGFNMDRLWIENRIDQILDLNIPFWLRDSSIKNVINKLPDTYKIFKNDHTACVLSEDFNVLNGSNSGMCALNLAYHMNPKEIYLLGFDMGKTGLESYWYPFYEYVEKKSIKDVKYRGWGREFLEPIKQCSKKGIKVFNVNPNKSIEGMNTLSFKEFVKCL